MFEETMMIGGLISLPAVCTAIGAATVFFLRKPPRAILQCGMLGFAAGVMIAASIWSLLLPAITYAETIGGMATWGIPVGGFCLGAAGLLALEHFGNLLLPASAQETCSIAGELLGQGSSAAQAVAVQTGECTRKEETADIQNDEGATAQVNAGRVILAITLHNLPEGMIVGLAAALSLAGSAEALAGAVALSIGIGLQNLPEGAAVSLPMRQAGKGRFVSFLAGAASGIVEPIGALIAIAAAATITPLMPWLLAAAAGAMVCVAAEDMIPIAMAKGRIGVISVVLGFALMMAMDVALG